MSGSTQNAPEVSGGMSVDQTIAMLMAAKSQGATQVRLAVRAPGRSGICSIIDWISMEPIDGVVYVGALDAKDEWVDMDNRALESLDW